MIGLINVRKQALKGTTFIVFRDNKVPMLMHSNFISLKGNKINRHRFCSNICRVPEQLGQAGKKRKFHALSLPPARSSAKADFGNWLWLAACPRDFAFSVHFGGVSTLPSFLSFLPLSLSRTSPPLPPKTPFLPSPPCLVVVVLSAE